MSARADIIPLTRQGFGAELSGPASTLELGAGCVYLLVPRLDSSGAGLELEPSRRFNPAGSLRFAPKSPDPAIVPGSDGLRMNIGGPEVVDMMEAPGSRTEPDEILPVDRSDTLDRALDDHSPHVGPGTSPPRDAILDPNRLVDVPTDQVGPLRNSPLRLRPRF